MLKRAKEEPLIDERIPHPYREVIKELRAIQAKLDEIKQRLPVAVAPPAAPPVVPAAPPVVVVKPPPVPAIALPKEEFREIYVEALREYGGLLLADDLYVETIDLGKDRSTSATIEEFPKLKGIALTIFKNTGTFDLYINEKDDSHKLTFQALTYPQTFLLDWFKAETFYVGNSVQSGKELILIGWKRI